MDTILSLLAAHIATLISMLVGGLIGWLATRHYYRKANRDLAAEARELDELTLRGQEPAGSVRLSRDSDGNIIGMDVTGSGDFKTGSKE